MVVDANFNLFYILRKMFKLSRDRRDTERTICFYIYVIIAVDQESQVDIYQYTCEKAVFCQTDNK